MAKLANLKSIPAASCWDDLYRTAPIQLFRKYGGFEYLGSGGYGQLFTAKTLGTDQEVVIKRCLNSEVYDFKEMFINNVMTKIPTEFIYLTKLANIEGVIQVYDLYTTSSHNFIVMEKLDTDLLDLVNKKAPLEEEQVRHIVYNVARIVDRIHQAGYMHQDLKLENIGLTKDGRVTIFDFGCADQIHTFKSKFKNQYCSHPIMTPIETIFGGVFTPMSESYQVGVLMAQLVLGENPFTSIEDVVSTDPSEFGDPKTMSQDVMCKLLAKRSSDRMSLSQLLLHPWFNFHP